MSSSKSVFPFPRPQNMQDSLLKPSQSNKNGEEAYANYPFSKSFLSSKSLEMCTESLGSETGSGIDHFTVDTCRGISQARKQQKPMKTAKLRSFPPPLSSISAQVHTHREGGRLVIKAFPLSSSGSSFQAERGNGRLKLSLLKHDEEEDGRFLVKEEGGKVWSNSSSRCNGDRIGDMNKRSQQFCVVGV
ncbi:protein FANTASTIC FOUR 3-like [Salvia miltiorrhiza]|uniref:protein FANTASTIC FOUR 3-like n=1 Tax=Salvia miltiorrhiza TaxID=226208 RepID=UPI0025AB9BBF|nr:protein FANTASTIC FOUR 3-like [Salvia miltiorrhiza]